MSLLDALITLGAFPKYSISSSVSPTFNLPLKIAIVAGTAPLSRIIFSTLSAVSTFLGYGIPCDIIVDSNATTGFPCSNAVFTSGLISKYFFIIIQLLHPSNIPSIPPVSRIYSW